MKKVVALVLTALLLMSVLVGCGETQKEYPTGPVEIVVPYAAGGGMDLLARSVQPYLAEKGIQTVVTNMPGGSTSIASMEVVHAPADGYKILCSSIETIISYNLGGALETEITDFSMLGCLVNDAQVIIVPKDSSFQTVGDLVAYAKDHPDEMNWAGTGSRGVGEMSAYQFFDAAGISLNYVPYESAADTRVAVMGNHVDVGMVFVPEAKALLESGDVRGLAVFTAQRSKLFPEIPSLKELGYDIDNGLHRGFFAQKDLPEDIRKVLADAFKYVADNEEFQKNMNEQCGFEAFYVAPEECAALGDEVHTVYTKLNEIMAAR